MIKKLSILLMAIIFSQTLFAASKWTDWRGVGLVYTYNDPDSLYVYLDGEECPNAKNYFTINPTQQSNAKQLISMVLTAKASKKKVRVFFDSTESSTSCFVRGLQIEG